MSIKGGVIKIKLILPKVNDEVLIKDDNYKRSDWKVGRITELFTVKTIRLEPQR